MSRHFGNEYDKYNFFYIGRDYYTECIQESGKLEVQSY